MGGIGDRKDPENAFRDWNIVFIPYCTGDMHIGNTIRTYVFKGKKIEIKHNGRSNSLEGLAWVFNNFKDPAKILVAGESTGAFASALYSPLVADHYPEKRFTRYAMQLCLALTVGLKYWIRSGTPKLRRTWGFKSARIFLKTR